MPIIMTGKRFQNQSPQPNSGLITHYTFDNTLSDSANSYDLTLNTGTANYVTGQSNQAIDFATQFGFNDSTNIPSGTNSASVSTWVNYDTLPAPNTGIFQAYIKSDGVASTDNKNIGIWIENTGYLWGRIMDGNNSAINFPKNFQTSSNTWYHIVTVVDENSSTVKQYVDNVEVSSVNYNGTLFGWDSLQVGRQGDGLAWDGRIDEVRFYNRALTVSEIDTLYNNP